MVLIEVWAPIETSKCMTVQEVNADYRKKSSGLSLVLVPLAPQPTRYVIVWHVINSQAPKFFGVFIFMNTIYSQ